MKKLISLCLSLILALGLVACGSDGGNPGNDEPYKIGIMQYDFTDFQGSQVTRLAEYLEKHFNVKFTLMSCGTGEQDVLLTVESLISNGMDAIIMNFTSPWAEIVQVCEENGVCVALYCNEIQEVQGAEFTKENHAFVCESPAGNSKGNGLGEIFAQFILDKGYNTVGSTSFSSFMFPGHYNPIIECKEIVESNGVTMLDTKQHLFAGVESEIVTYLTSNEMDVLYAGSAGMDYAYPAVVNLGLAGKIPIMTNGHGVSGTREAIADGSVVLVTQPIMDFSLSFMLVYDQLEGKIFEDMPATTPNLSSGYFVMDSLEKWDLYEKYVCGDYDINGPAINADEMKSLMRSFNENATYAQFVEFINNISLETLAARREG